MKPAVTRCSSKRSAAEQGIGLPAAIFVITIMATLAVAVNLLVSSSAQYVEEDILLTRAFYAAESGAGLVLTRLLPAGEYPAYDTAAHCPASTTFDFSVAGLSGCLAQVSCSTYAEVDGQVYYLIESLGQCAQVSAMVEVRTRR